MAPVNVGCRAALGFVPSPHLVPIHRKQLGLGARWEVASYWWVVGSNLNDGQLLEGCLLNATLLIIWSTSNIQFAG